MPLPLLLAAIPGLLGGAGGIMGALGGAGGIMGMLSNILPFSDLLGNLFKSFSPDKQENDDKKKDAAAKGGGQAKQDADDFLTRVTDGLPSLIKPFPLLNLLS
jgi:hypothetical protein